MISREFRKIFPDEYGAWAMWIVPFLTGAKAAHVWNGKTFLWFLFLTVFYILKNPFLEWAIKNPSIFQSHPDRRGMIFISSAFPIVALAGGIWFFAVAEPGSALIVTGFSAALMIIYLTLDIRKQGRSLFGQWIGVFLLSLAAPLTAVALGASVNRMLVTIWLVNSLYFAHSIYTIRGWINSRKRGMQNQTACALFKPLFIYWAVSILLAITAMLLGLIPTVWWVILVPTTIFIGIFAGGLFRKVTIRQIGFLEVAHTLIFATIFLILIS